MTIRRIENVTRSTPMDRLMKIANDPRNSFDLMHEALTEICRRMRHKSPPSPTAREVLDEVWRNEGLSVELRARAAMAVLPFYPQPVGDADTTQGDK